MPPPPPLPPESIARQNDTANKPPARGNKQSREREKWTRASERAPLSSLGLDAPLPHVFCSLVVCVCIDSDVCCVYIYIYIYDVYSSAPDVYIIRCRMDGNGIVFSCLREPPCRRFLPAESLFCVYNILPAGFCVYVCAASQFVCVDGRVERFASVGTT